jgi:hypothetical protein
MTHVSVWLLEGYGGWSLGSLEHIQRSPLSFLKARLQKLTMNSCAPRRRRDEFREDNLPSSALFKERFAEAPLDSTI